MSEIDDKVLVRTRRYKEDTLRLETRDEIVEEFNSSESDLEEEDEEFEDCNSNRYSNCSDNDHLTLALTNDSAKPTTTTTEAATAKKTTTRASSVSSSIDSSTDDVIVDKVNTIKSPNDTNVEINVEYKASPRSELADSERDNDDDDNYYSEEESTDGELIVELLSKANEIAEARLATRRQARTEAREIRMRELERQQRSQEQNADKVFDAHTSPSVELSRIRIVNGTRASSMSSHRSSEDTHEEEGRRLSDPRHELKDAEERFRKAMISNAQLDNERASQSYQIQNLKDQVEQFDECNRQLQRELKDKSRECNTLQRSLDKISDELKLVHGQLNERDTLIAEKGLVVVTVENEEGTDARRTLISAENAQYLSSVKGSLDVRLRMFYEEKQVLVEEIQRLKAELEKYNGFVETSNHKNSPERTRREEEEAHREVNNIISDYKFRLQKAEEDIASLRANLTQSETELVRYKSAAKAAEKAEMELKSERCKLQSEKQESIRLP